MSPKLVAMILIFVAACSDPRESLTTYPPEAGTLRLAPASSTDGGPDAHLLETLDTSIAATGNLPSQEYQDSCWRSQYWHCPPFDEVWRVEVVFDVCDDEGVPCTPNQQPDPSCRWTLVSEGECSHYQDCDPADLRVSYQPCQVEDLEGQIQQGQQEVRCRKGALDRGECTPCSGESCNGRDDDCDGLVDEGVYECVGECGEGIAECVDGTLGACRGPSASEEVCDLEDNDCDGLVDEGQLNACGNCGGVPEETCDGIDNDCDGDLDEELIQICESRCEEGVQLCVSGRWSACTARTPREETCDASDNDCDGRIDETLTCTCPPEILGALMPCQEPPLECGSGFKVCECAGDNCISTQWTPCRAPCQVLGVQPCDPSGGVPTDEICNAYDDNCNEAVDEDLFRECYSGPEGTLGVGLCSSGSQNCSSGRWGSEVRGLFVEDICLDEILPREEICNGEDDNCDGEIEEDLQPTDIMFVVDTSGSMREEIRAVQEAMTAFSASFQGSPALRWGLIVGPVGPNDRLELVVHPVPFDQFIPALASVAETNTSEEMLRDALYLCVRNLVPFGTLPPEHVNIRWGNSVGFSTPPLVTFNVRWREAADKVIIILTDEESQSYLVPQIETEFLAQALQQVAGLSVHIFTTPNNADNGVGPWAPLAVGGRVHALTSQPDEMFMEMMGILDEEVCRGD
jgi:hypothetical protein